MDTWGTPKYNATKMTGDMVWDYGRNHTWTDKQGRELPFFTEGEKKTVYEDQKSKQQWAQQQQKEANEQELRRVQIQRARELESQGDQLRSPAAIIQPFAFGAFGAPVFAAYAGIQTGKSIGDAYNACKDGLTTNCAAETAHAGIAIATDVYALKSGAPAKGPQVDASVSGEITSRKLPDGPPHAPAEPKVIVDRSAYDIGPTQADKMKALGLDPSKTRVVANASDGQGADFQVVHTDAGGTGSLYGAMSIKPGGEIRVTTGHRSLPEETHQDLMNDKFGARQEGERRFGIEGGMGDPIVTRTSGTRDTPSVNDLPAIQRALSEAGILDRATVMTLDGNQRGIFTWADGQWKKLK